MVFALACDLLNICQMTHSRAARLSFLIVALAASSAANASVVPVPAPADPNITMARIHRTPATPLEEIPVYSMAPDARHAVSALEAEIERLYVHAKSLPSGAPRWEFQTRIYRLEKQLDPLLKEFNAERWESLRTAVKREWQAVQATLAPAAPVVASVTEPAA